MTEANIHSGQGLHNTHDLFGCRTESARDETEAGQNIQRTRWMQSPCQQADTMRCTPSPQPPSHQGSALIAAR